MSSHCLTLFSNLQLHPEETKKERKGRKKGREKIHLQPHGPVWPNSFFPLHLHLCHSSLLHTLITILIFPLHKCLKPSFILEFCAKGHLLPRALFFTSRLMLSLSGPVFNVSIKLTTLRRIHHLWPFPWIKVTIFFIYTCLLAYYLSSLLNLKCQRKGIKSTLFNTL